MAEEKMMRLSQVARKLNVGLSTITDHLSAKGFEIENNPNSKITMEQFNMLMKEFESSVMDKKEASGLTIGKKHTDNIIINSEATSHKKKEEEEEEIFIKNLALEKEKELSKERERAAKAKQEEEETERLKEAEELAADPTKVKLQGIKVVGKIELDTKSKKDKEKEKQLEKEKEKEKQLEKEKLLKEQQEKERAKLQQEKEQQLKEAEKAKEKKIQQEAKEKELLKVKEVEPEVVKEKAEPVAKIVEKPVVQEPITPVPTEELIEAKGETLKGLTVLGKIALPEKAKKKDKPVASSDEQNKKKNKRKRKRLTVGGTQEGGATTTTTQQNQGQNQGGGQQQGHGQRKQQGGGHHHGGHKHRHQHNPPAVKEEVSDKEIQDKIKATLAKLSAGKGGGSSANRAKYRKEKRSAIAEANEERMLQEEADAKILKVTEYISANDLASLIGVTVNEVISVCLSLGMFVSINQRLDAEAITVIADEFGYNVEFISAEEEATKEEVEVEDQADLKHRPPVVTIMGHVDHGKTSLLDYIRKAKVAAGEAGGITQHIGAYSVTTDSGKKITFLDTPGHEAFTAMRARGAKVTDIVIIVVAADDSVMPQTKEAINHAQVAGVPIVIAINKVDKPSANPDKIKEELAKENILVEDWGGKYQCELISAKSGKGIPELLEKVLLEAEILDLKANPDRNAKGTVVEASLDKGRGYLASVLVQTGTLNVGDIVLAGAHYGRVKAMTDHRGQRLKTAGPSIPVQVLGLDGAPQAGDKFQVMESEREAREIANKRLQLQREQSIRTKKHITLDEIGRRLAIGNFKELNIIVKGDVDGSVEALSDSLLKLSTPEVQVRIIHKGVGQISESDVLLASASDAVIVGFQVRPSGSARKLADQEEIEIRLYSIIYDAINEVKDAMEGMLAPTMEEVIVGNAEVRQVFKISKVGTIAGCYLTEGIIKRNSHVRLVRDGIVVHSGHIDALKRFKDDVSEVKSGYECGLSLKGYNDIREGDNIEAFEQREKKRTL
jgi:translation initiation factor IF-2